VFECLACNLLQISLLKLFEKLRFKKKCVLRMQEMLFRVQNLKNFLGGYAPIPPSYLVPAALYYPGGKGKENRPLAVLPRH
jgi:hypothetical protein